jgi:hypothetical protein
MCDKLNEVYGNQVGRSWRSEGAQAASAPENFIHVNVRPAKNGYLISTDGYRGGRHFSNQYVATTRAEVAELVKALLAFEEPEAE